MTDIRKLYAKKMEALAGIHDGSTGQLGRGYSVVTACAFHLAGRAKAQPWPLLFEVFSSAEEDLESQNTFWLDAIDRMHAVAPRATIAIDREGDNGKLLRRLLDLHQPFVTRLNTHEPAGTCCSGPPPERASRTLGRKRRCMGNSRQRASPTTAAVRPIDATTPACGSACRTETTACGCVSSTPFA